jgi:predicted Zn-dependent protease
MMTQDRTNNDQSTHAAPNKRGPIAAVAVLTGLLAVGAVFVIRSVTQTPAESSAKTPKAGVAETVEAGLQAAATYTRDKKFDEATAILEKLVERAPTDQAVRVAYAQSLLGKQKFNGAYEQYEAAISLRGMPTKRPTDAEVSSIARDPSGAALHFEAGTCANTAGKPERAVEHYWMAQTLDNTEERYPLFLGMMQLKTGDDGAATASLIRAAKLKPDLAEAWGTLAEIALRKNQLGIATQHLDKAIKLQPEVARWRITQARILNREGKPEQAASVINALDQATRMDPNVLALMTETYGLLGKPADAATMWAEAAKLRSGDAETIYQAAVWAQRAKRDDQAKSFAKTAAMLGHEGAKEMVKGFAR